MKRVTPVKERLPRILKALEKTYPSAHCELDFQDPLQLLVAVILSAQCTDKRVNLVTPALFRKYRTAADYAKAPREEIESLIRSTGFFRSKAKSIQGACRVLVERHGGKVPAAMEALLPLPGVGRKTANVILGTAFGIVSGVVVDTHMTRLSRRLGFTRQTDPVKIEKDLMRLIPRERWMAFSHQMVWHGRRLCFARKPDCAACPLRNDCPSAVY